MILRATITRSASVLAVAGLLLQLVLGHVPAVRGLPPLPLTGWPTALCTAGSVAPSHEHDAPASPHDCDACIVCLLHVDASGLIPAAAQLRVIVAHIHRLRWAISATLPGARPFRLYSSRAPPAVV